LEAWDGWRNKLFSFSLAFFNFKKNNKYLKNLNGIFDIILNLGLNTTKYWPKRLEIVKK
jgi:hypothetical protein